MPVLSHFFEQWLIVLEKVEGILKLGIKFVADGNMPNIGRVLPEPLGSTRDINGLSLVKIILFIYVRWEGYNQPQLTKKSTHTGISSQDIS